MSGDKSFAVRELEARLYRYMRIPVVGVPVGDGPPEQWSPEEGRGGTERLRQAVCELRQEAAKIGKIPSGYPRHIDLVMRLISALLPWYTRNLVQFGRQTTEAVRVIAGAVEQLAQRQWRLEAELNRLRAVDPTSQRHTKNPGSPESRIPGGP